MLRRRILYGLVLAAALLFQIFYDRYLARYVLAGVVSLPILSLLLALPGAFCLRMELEADGPEICRGAAGQWRLRVARPAFCPISGLFIGLRFGNDLTDWAEQERLMYVGLPDEQLTLPIRTDHCGRMTCRVTRAGLLDGLGLFTVPVRLPPPAAVLVLPVPVRQEELPRLEVPEDPTGAEGNSRIPNGDYELRDYRAGDPLRSVHWKLSSKRDKLVVREWRSARNVRIILAVDRFGTPEQLDRTLDRLCALSAQLLDRDCPHIVQWQEGEEIHSLSVSDRGALLTCLGALLSSPAPLQGTPMAEERIAERGICLIRVGAGGEEEP